MKIRLDREIFLGKLQKVVKFIPNKPLIPAFLNIKLTVTGGIMEIVASDQNNQIKIYCPADCKEDVAMCVPAKLLLKTISLFRENEVVITKKNDKKIDLKCGKSKYNISIDCLPEDYPLLELKSVTSEINVGQFFLGSAMKIAEKFVDEDGKHANLMGIKIEEIKNRIIFTGADHIGMSRVSVKPISNTNWDPVVINTDTATKIMSLLEDQGEITIVHNNEKVKFLVGSESKDTFEVCAVTSNIKFPNTEKLFNTRPEKYVLINTAEFKDAVKRLSLYSSGDDGKFYTMSSNGSNEMLLVSSNENLGHDGEETMTIVNEGGNSFMKRFNSEVTLQILNNIGENDFMFMFPDTDRQPSFITPKIDEDREEMLSFLIVGHII